MQGISTRFATRAIRQEQSYATNGGVRQTLCSNPHPKPLYRMHVSVGICAGICVAIALACGVQV